MCHGATPTDCSVPGCARDLLQVIRHHGDTECLAWRHWWRFETEWWSIPVYDRIDCSHRLATTHDLLSWSSSTLCRALISGHFTYIMIHYPYSLPRRLDRWYHTEGRQLPQPSRKRRAPLHAAAERVKRRGAARHCVCCCCSSCSGFSGCDWDGGTTMVYIGRVRLTSVDLMRTVAEHIVGYDPSPSGNNGLPSTSRKLSERSSPDPFRPNPAASPSGWKKNALRPCTRISRRLYGLWRVTVPTSADGHHPRSWPVNAT